MDTETNTEIAMDTETNTEIAMDTETKKGYKITNNGWCREMKYEVGETYTNPMAPVLCKCGFHYCEDPDDMFSYYFYSKDVTKIFEIEDLGMTVTESDKSVTNKLKIVREIPFEEWNTLFKLTRFDERKNLIRREFKRGSWYELEYDSKDRVVHTLDSTKAWCKYEYDNDGVQRTCSRGHY